MSLLSRRLALAALLALLAPAANAQVAARIADLRLATAVRLALVADARTRPLDVGVIARDGGVEITGDVPAAQRATVGEVARGVRGVRVVGGLGSVGDVAAPPVRVQPSAESRPSPARPEASERPAEAARPASGAAYHTVEPGDTLFSLARRYETTVEAILGLNDMRAPDIRVGQRLRVR